MSETDKQNVHFIVPRNAIAMGLVLLLLQFIGSMFFVGTQMERLAGVERDLHEHEQIVAHSRVDTRITRLETILDNFFK